MKLSSYFYLAQDKALQEHCTDSKMTSMWAWMIWVNRESSLFKKLMDT